MRGGGEVVIVAACTDRRLAWGYETCDDKQESGFVDECFGLLECMYPQQVGRDELESELIGSYRCVGRESEAFR